MRIAILGSGAMGSLYGGKLKQAFPDWSVCLVDVWPEHIEAIRTRGLLLEGEAGPSTIPISACTPQECTNPVDLVIVFTKTMHTEAALSAASALIDSNTYLMTLQNGLGNVERLEQYAPRERIVVGVTNFPSDLLGPGHLRSIGLGETNIMGAHGKESEMLKTIAGALTKAGLHTYINPEVIVAIWEKATFNAALNGLCTILGKPVGVLSASPHAKSLINSIVQEACATAHANDIAVQQERIMSNIGMALREHQHHKPSMLQDSLEKRAMEVDSIQGAFVQAATNKQLSIPVMNTICLLLKSIQDSYNWQDLSH